MKTVDEWKALLRSRIRAALGAKDRHALATLRETLAAIENAEAQPMSNAPANGGAVFAGSAGGLGAGEAARLVLTPEAVAAIIEQEIRERHAAAALYVGLGRHEEAGMLSSQADLLATLAGEAS